MNGNHTALVILAQGCEELEAVTIIDLLRRAGVDVTVAGLNDEVIVASRGVKLVPDCTLKEAMVEQHPYEMVVLPGGGGGATHLANDARVLNLVSHMANKDRFTCAICAAPMVLAKAGVLDGKRATAYPGVLDSMDLPGVVYTGEAVVRDGNVITSRGPGTAMDFALELISALAGDEKRNEVENSLVRP